ncbi:MAG: DNA-processing protein DprA [Dissulfuribacterales bacterium]
MSAESSIETWITLQHIRGVGNLTLRRLIERLGSPEAVLEVKNWQEYADWLPNRTITLLSTGPDCLRANNSWRIFQRMDNAWAVSYWDEGYPACLRDIANPPVILYGCGDISILHKPAVAVIGARKCSTYGQKVAREFAADLARNGVNVVSGLAVGIDAAAHEAALNAGGVSTAVKGCGLDVWYPRHSREFLQKMQTNGLILSEFPPGTPPEARNFPVRNRIVSGLSLGVVVVEAGRKSGTIITASYAMEQGREVMAVPGSVHAPTSAGVHWLIRKGAVLVENVEEILFQVGLGASKRKNEQESEAMQPVLDEAFSLRRMMIDGLTPEEKLVLDRLSSQPVHIDDLAELCGLPVSDLSVVLLQLELKDLVEALPGQVYRGCL